MSTKLKFKPVITRIKLNPEQAVLVCSCFDVGLSSAYTANAINYSNYPQCEANRTRTAWNAYKCGTGSNPETYCGTPGASST